ncbi:MAG: hypothetical protein QOD82_151 [Pseudonocardiales bacterium]|nr:hypothetical protein [Pseudonocardiales bacterium]
MRSNCEAKGSLVPELIFNSRTGRWDEPDPAYCPAGVHLTKMLRGWGTCRCGGHRTWDCLGEHDHTDVGTMPYDPPIGDLCTIDNVGLTAPDGLTTTVDPEDLDVLRERFARG